MKTRLNFSQAIAMRGINATKEIANLKRRQRHALTCDRPKVFASTPLSSTLLPWNYYRNGRRITNGTIEADLRTLRLAAADPTLQLRPTLPSTADYVAAWCRLNRLKP